MQTFRALFRLHEIQGVPARFGHCSHASITEDGSVAVGQNARGYILGHVLRAKAPSRDEEGLLAALREEDEELSRPLSEEQLKILAQEPWARP